MVTMPITIDQALELQTPYTVLVDSQMELDS